MTDRHPIPPRPGRMERHATIEAVTPSISCGRHPVKRVAGDRLVVEADVFRDGHGLLRAVVQYRREDEREVHESPMSLVAPGLDRWRGHVELTENARWRYTVAAWTDRFGSWLHDFRRWVGGGAEVAAEIAEGAALLDEVARAAGGEDRHRLRSAAKALATASEGPAALAIVTAPGLEDCVARWEPREDLVVHEPWLHVVVDRPRALHGAWYELFVRSQGRQPGVGATFRDAEARLPDIAAMGFDVIYLAPIHPIGRTHRKGRDNTLVAAPGDPGSPWAIGSEDGGHDAVEPALGTLEDFARFQSAARELGMELALDFAIQASPDHPWVKQHPEWFRRRPDGSIRYAENPPKRYEDIHPVDFDTADREGLWKELLRVVTTWVERGVRIFRVDNPHTKPLVFWEWLIRTVQSQHPDVIFLSEAFTRPRMMQALAKVGFTQSYTYFTWRNTRAELIEYLLELTSSGMEEYYRPNFFVNTPDILPPVLQGAGPAAFRLRLLLAATLSPTYGIYSGYELCEGEAIPGREEYLHSEKYEVKVRDWDAPGNIKPFIAQVNRIRRENEALHDLRNVSFLQAANDRILACARTSEDPGRTLLVIANLDPDSVQETTVHVPPALLGVEPGARYRVRDLLSGEVYEWGQANYVRLDPAVTPGHVLRLEGTAP